MTDFSVTQPRMGILARPERLEVLRGTAHVSIDLETFGTKPGCQVLAVGAQGFIVPQQGPAHLVVAADMEVVCDTEEQARMGLTTDPDTLAWWNAPEQEAAKDYIQVLAQLDGRAVPRIVFNLLHEVIVRTSSALQKTIDGPMDPETRLRVTMWGNSARFDLGILEALGVTAGIQLPWKFWEEADVRTMSLLHPSFRVKPTGMDAHTPLADARAQALTVCRAVNNINGYGLMTEVTS